MKKENLEEHAEQIKQETAQDWEKLYDMLPATKMTTKQFIQSQIALAKKEERERILEEIEKCFIETNEQVKSDEIHCGCLPYCHNLIFSKILKP